MNDECARDLKYAKDKGKLVALLLKIFAHESDTKEEADVSRDYCKVICGSSHRDTRDLVTQHVEKASRWLHNLKKIGIDGESWMQKCERKAQDALYGQHTLVSETSRRRKPTLYDAYGVLRESKIGQSSLTHIASWGNAWAPAYRALLVKRKNCTSYIGDNDLFRAYSNLLLESSRMQLASIFYSRGTRPLEGFSGIDHTIKLLSTLSTLIKERVEAEACGKMATVLATYVVETIKHHDPRDISFAAAPARRTASSDATQPKSTTISEARRTESSDATQPNSTIGCEARRTGSSDATKPNSTTASEARRTELSDATQSNSTTASEALGAESTDSTQPNSTNASSQGGVDCSSESTRLLGQRCHRHDENSTCKTNSITSGFTEEEIHVVIAAGESGTLRKSQSSAEADTLLLDFGGQVICVIEVKRDSETLTVEAFGKEVRCELDRLFVLAASLGATKTSPRGCDTTKFTEELSTSGLSAVSSSLTFGSQLAAIKRAFHDKPFQLRDFYSMNEKIFAGGILPCMTCAALYIALTAFYVSHILLEKGDLTDGLSDRNDELSLSFWLSVVLPELSFRYASLSRWYRQDEWATPVVLAKWIAASDLGVKAYHRTVRISVFTFFGFFSSVVFTTLHLAVIHIKLILAMAITIYVFRWAVNVASMQKAYNRAIELSQQINIVSEPGVFGQMSEYLENALCGSQVLKWGYVVIGEMTQLESWFRPAWPSSDSLLPMKRLGCGVVERTEIQRVIPFDIKPLIENLVGPDHATLGGELCPITGMWGAEQAVAIRKYLKDDDGPDKLRQALRETPPSVRTHNAQGSFDLQIMSMTTDAKSHTQIIQLAARGAYVRGQSRPLRGALVGDRSSVHERNLTRFHMCESRRAAIEWCVNHKNQGNSANANNTPPSRRPIFAATSESIMVCVTLLSGLIFIGGHIVDSYRPQYGVPIPIFFTCFSCLGYLVTALGYDCLDAYTSLLCCQLCAVAINLITGVYAVEETLLQDKLTHKTRDDDGHKPRENNGQCTHAVWLWSIELINISNLMVFCKCARTTAYIERNREIIILPESVTGVQVNDADDRPICKKTEILDQDARESCLHGPSFCGKAEGIPSFWEEKFDQRIVLE